MLTNADRVASNQAMPMGTIRGAGSTMGSDFDANNRTMSVSNGANSTIRREIGPAMQQPIRTEYDRPFISREERERASASKDYLKDTAHI